jgi:predicted extracellular nuclease
MLKKISFLWAVLLVLGLGPWGVQAAPVSRQNGCGDPATLIHAVQGSEDRSPLDTQTLTIEGVVVGDFQDRDTQLGGFFVQEEDADADADPQTSEGLFVYDPGGSDVNAGDVVRVTGTISEWSSSGVTLTELKSVNALAVCRSGATVTPAAITLPLNDLGDWERYEGMLVTFPQTLTVDDLYSLGRYGEVTLSSGGRLYQPTNVAQPGAEADAVADENARRSIILDDGNTQQNADPIRYPAGGLSAGNVLRAGYTVSGLTGVLDQRFGAYRVQATVTPEFDAGNPRPVTPPDVGGRLRLASFNVLNYFNGDGVGGGFPTERGASSTSEFTRQRDKIINAILALNVDVVGLLEIENDGDGPDSAVADLVNGLNEAAGEVVFAYVPDPAGLKMPADGGDAIKPAIIYRLTTVTPVGDPVAALEPPFDQRRPSMVQAFEEKTTGERFILVVNHLKSKGCDEADAAGDGDTGQGCWNHERTLAAQVLTGWLATDPTGTGEPDVLLIGDLNAYAQEDPLMAFADAGYNNLVVQFEGHENYSYVFSGQAGSLDHALASVTLAGQVTGTATWHINADEPPLLDYNVEYKSARQVESLYDPGPYRSSDHDLVIVGLELGGVVIEPTTVPTTAPTTGPTTAPTAAPTVEPTAQPSDESDDDGGLTDSPGGILVIVGGVVAVIVAAVAGVILGAKDRRRSR